VQHVLAVLVIALGPPTAVAVGYALRGRWIAAHRPSWYVFVVPPTVWFLVTQSPVALVTVIIVCGFLSGFIEAEWSGTYRGDRPKIAREIYGGVISAAFIVGLASLLILLAIELLAPGTIPVLWILALAALVGLSVIGMFHDRWLPATEDPFGIRQLR